MTRRRKVAVVGVDSVEKMEIAPKVKKPSKGEKPAKKFKSEPEWMNGDGINVVKLVLSIQKSECNTVKVITELTKLYNKVGFTRLDVFAILTPITLFQFQMGHDAFMAAFLKMVLVFLTQDENNENAPRVIKFLGIFVASFGEENDDEGGTHAIIQHTFRYILSVNLRN